VKNRFTGLLSHGIDGTTYAIKQLLTNPEYARWLGENGREHVRQNFLITRHLRDYLLLFISLERTGRGNIPLSRPYLCRSAPFMLYSEKASDRMEVNGRWPRQEAL
jgi:Fe-S-cluster containining protein